MSEEQPESFVDLCDALDEREQAFVSEFIECLDKTRAARRVYGAKHANRKGFEVAQRPDVAAAIAAGLREQKERTSNDPDRIIRQLMELAYADPIDLTGPDGEWLPLRELAPEIRRALVSIDVEHVETTGEDGAKTSTTRVLKYRLAPKTPHLELLGKRLKMFTDRLEVEVSDGRAARIAAARKRVSR